MNLFSGDEYYDDEITPAPIIPWQESLFHDGIYEDVCEELGFNIGELTDLQLELIYDYLYGDE